MNFNTGYSAQVNQFLQPYIQKLDPKLQGVLQPHPQIQRFLDKLQEEASEIIQAVSKIRRFGPDNKHPDRKTTNKTELIAELEDFLALIAVLEAQSYFDLSQSREAIKTKAEALLR